MHCKTCWGTHWSIMWIRFHGEPITAGRPTVCHCVPNHQRAAVFAAGVPHAIATAAADVPRQFPDHPGPGSGH